MEQYTWPRCSNGRQAPHAFSSISISDYRSQLHRGSGLGSVSGSCSVRRNGANEDRHSHRTLVSHEEKSADHRSNEEERPGHPCKAERIKERHLSHESLSISNNDLSNMDFLSLRRLSSRDKPGPSCLESRFWADGNQKTSGSTTALSFPISSSPLQLARRDESGSSFSALPFDVLTRIAGSFSWPNLWAASRVCRYWNQALAPLREAMLFVHWGKKFKHGRGGVSRNLDKALDSFLKGAVRGCAAAMVDAGLLLWDMGRKEEGIYWYKQAAELGDPAGQCNLGLAYLQDQSDSAEAVKWFHQAAFAGHARAQYSLALCLQQGRGVEANALKAARWYLRAAEGGSARGMYNLALCYLKGEGMKANLREARRWMKQAALLGHRKAQFEHGLTLFAEGDGGLALVFLELATRAGETAATHLRDALLQKLSPKLCAHAITCADKWQVKQGSRS